MKLVGVAQPGRARLSGFSAFALSGRWGFQFALTCSKPRVGAFGGGAHLLDLATGETLAWTSTDRWLADHLKGGSADVPDR